MIRYTLTLFEYVSDVVWSLSLNRNTHYFDFNSPYFLHPLNFAVVTDTFTEAPLWPNLKSKKDFTHTHKGRRKTHIQQFRSRLWPCCLSAVAPAKTEADEARYDIKQEEGWHESITPGLESSALQMSPLNTPGSL